MLQGLMTHHDWSPLSNMPPSVVYVVWCSFSRSR
jgi:hypothetical protein